MSTHTPRSSLRERYLAQQQAQLAEDAALPDPADAYRTLIAELYEDERRGALDGQSEAA